MYIGLVNNIKPFAHARHLSDALPFNLRRIVLFTYVALTERSQGCQEDGQEALRRCQREGLSFLPRKIVEGKVEREAQKSPNICLDYLRLFAKCLKECGRRTSRIWKGCPLGTI